MMPPLREADRHVVCGPCQVRMPASYLRCPVCHSPSHTDNKGLCHLGAVPEHVEVVWT